MPCFHPLEGWRKPDGGLTFRPQDSIGVRLAVPCGQCIGCRIDYSKMWAARMMHEAQLHDQNCFITLTYDQEHLPPGNTLVKCHLQKFFKRLRKSLGDKKVSYYSVGEYGELNQRPHYHAILFGHDFGDRVLFTRGHDYLLHTSAELSKLWPDGHCTVGDVTPQTCAYTARYVLKKINGAKAAEHYERVNPHTGQIHQVQPEYSAMSRRPPIAQNWFQRYATDVFPDDFVLLNGKKSKTPRYYDKLLDKVDPAQLEKIKQKRLDNAKRHRDNNTDERLAVREKVLKAKLKTLERQL